MFDKHATRLTRVDWTKYATAALNPSSGQEPTAEQLKQAIEGMATGFRQFTEELSQVLGGFDIPLKHRAPLILSGYESDAPGVSPDDDMEDFYPRQATISGDSYYDPSDETVKGGQAAVFQGVTILKPNINNVVINQNNNAQNRIVLIGGNDAGIKFENGYFCNLYDCDGNPWSSSLPIGSVIMWAGSVASIPSGWALMDGTANAAGSGVDMRGRLPYGYSSGDPTFGTNGASVASSFTATISGSGGTVTSSSATTGISISDHAAHAHNIENEAIRDSITASMTSGTPEDADSGSGYSLVYWSSTPTIMISAVGSPSTFDTANFGPQTHSITDTGHTHTVSINTMAAGLSIGTPSTNTPAGKVLAFIERIS